MNPTNPEESRTALVLSGGGAKGAFQVGALEVLREEGYTYDAISGVSVGSLNGAMLATDQFDGLLDIWRGITPAKVYREHSLIKLAQKYIAYKLGVGRPPVSKYHNKPLQDMMKHHLLGKKVKVPFHFGYVKMESGEYIQAIIRRSEGHSVDQADLDRVLASTAIPVYFNPVRIGESTAVDGGVRNISPISDILPHKPDRLVIIPTEPFGKDSDEFTEVRDIMEIAFRSINIMLDEIFNEDIDRFLSINRLVRQAESEDVTLTKKNGTSYNYIEPILIAPKESLGSAQDFGNERANRLLDLGRKRAREVLDGIQSQPV